jgi:hypothetical protein
MKPNPIEEEKSRRVFGAWPIDGKPIRTLDGMIYWYGWGDDEDFDIRIVRRILGLPEDQPKIDKWFMAKRPNLRKSYIALCHQLSDALAATGRHFADVIAEHDAIIDREANAFFENFSDDAQHPSSLGRDAEFDAATAASDVPKMLALMPHGSFLDSEIYPPF